MIRAELAGVELARGDAEFARQKLVLVGVLHVDLQEGHVLAGVDELADGVSEHRCLAGGSGTGGDGDLHAKTSCNSSPDKA